MIAALVTGSLFRAPEQRTSKAGREFATATILVKGNDGSSFIRVAAFSESAQNELMRLGDGDAISVQGSLKVELYTSADNISKISLSIVADNILHLRQPPRERRTAEVQKVFRLPEAKSRQERLAGSWKSPGDGPNDEIPF
jgi:single-stranded DNA-binding protein